MLKYLPALIALGAVLIGVRGGTWNEKLSGWRRITRTGWLSLLLGLAACTIAILQTQRTAREIKWQDRQRAEIRGIAEGELHEALLQLLWPFEVLYDQVENDFPEMPQFDMEPYEDTDKWAVCLTDTNFTSKLQRYDLCKRPTHCDPTDETGKSLTWAQLFYSATTRSLSGIDATLQKYAMYLDAKTIIDVKRLQKHEFTELGLQLKMKHWTQFQTARDEQNEVLVSHVFFGPRREEPYGEFIRLATRLVEELQYPRWRKETEDKIREYYEANKSMESDK